MKYYMLCCLVLSCACFAETPCEKLLREAAKAEVVYGLRDDPVCRQEWLVLRGTSETYIRAHKLERVRDALYVECRDAPAGTESEIVRRFQTCCEDNKNELESVLADKAEIRKATLDKLVVLYNLAYDENCAIPARIRVGVTKERLDNLNKYVCAKTKGGNK